ncbi:MAG: hypothetical protein OXL68_14910 [Paracoccaceae bacterium]|nr:hypothetical protein [Paracoccaceae bacterium]
MAWQPTPEQKRLIDEGRRAFEEEADLSPPSQAFQAKMDDQALTNAVLARLGQARDIHREVDALDRDAIEDEFADVLNANAYDEDDGSPNE